MIKELNYPFDAQWILKKKKSIRQALLHDENVSFMEKKIAIPGGSTTNDVKNILELFLLNYGIKPAFYESEYNQYYEEAMFPNEELEKFAPDLIYFHTSNRNITEFPTVGESEEAVEQMLKAAYGKFEAMWERAADVYHCPIIQNNFEMPYWRLLGNSDASSI